MVIGLALVALSNWGKKLFKLKKKLSAFLEAGCDVTVVYPMIRKKRLIHVDVETGEIVRTRMSPKSVKLPDMFCELVYLSDFLPLPGFSVAAVSLDAEVYKKCSSRGSKKGNADRLDCIPTEILESIAFSSSDDYRALLPLSELEAPFTASDLAAVIGCRIESARSMLLVLRKMGIVEKLDEREKKTRRAIFRVLPKEAE